MCLFGFSDSVCVSLTVHMGLSPPEVEGSSLPKTSVISNHRSIVFLLLVLQDKIVPITG